DAADGLAVEPDDAVFAEEAAVALADAVDLPAAVDRGQDGGADDCVQAGRVAAAGVERNASDRTRHDSAAGISERVSDSAPHRGSVGPAAWWPVRFSGDRPSRHPGPGAAPRLRVRCVALSWCVAGRGVNGGGGADRIGAARVYAGAVRGCRAGRH